MTEVTKTNVNNEQELHEYYYLTADGQQVIIMARNALEAGQIARNLWY